jgi:hypothetical protein
MTVQRYEKPIGRQILGTVNNEVAISRTLIVCTRPLVYIELTSAPCQAL